MQPDTRSRSRSPPKPEVIFESALRVADTRAVERGSVPMCIRSIQYGLLLASLLAVSWLSAERTSAQSTDAESTRAEEEVRDDSALALLPDETLGFVWVRNVEDMDVKIAAFMQRFGVPLPSPLKFLKFATGLSAGIDADRDLLVALLPPGAGSRDFRPLVLLPVDDYGKLAASVRGDASGEICRVTISGEDVLIARDRSHALLMNVEHRTTMTHLLKREPQLLATLRPLNPWLETNDLAVVVSPVGMKVLFALGRKGLAQSQQHFEQSIEQVPMEALVAQVRQSFAIYRAVLDVTDAQVESSALGVKIGKQSQLKIGARLILAKNSEFAQFRFAPLDRRRLKSGQALLLDLSHSKGSPEQAPTRGVTQKSKGEDAEVAKSGNQGEAYVAAVAGTIPKGWGELIAKVGCRLNQRFPDLEGYGRFEQADWDKVEQSYRAMSAGVRAISLVMRVVREDEPLLSGFYGVLQVEDAAAYLASYRLALKLDNELVQRSSCDIKLLSELSPVTVAGAEGIKVVTDIAAATGDQNNLVWRAILNNFLGADGKLKMHLLAVDKTHVILSTAVEDNLARLVGDFRADGRQEKPAPIGAFSLQTTLGMITKDSSWVATVSPRGTVQWITRWMKVLMDQFGQPLQIPPFPPTPPIGFSFNLVQTHCEVDMVLPAETLDGLAKFIQSVH